MARVITGTVSSTKSNKSIVVIVATRRTHPIYKKQYTVHRKFMAHDEAKEAKVGDTVLIAESRPISAKKRFNLERVLERAAINFKEADATADIPEPEKPPAKKNEVNQK